MLILRRECRAELTVKKSRFLAEATFVSSGAAARELWQARKRTYDNGGHLVFAFVCGPHGEVMGCSDDGEPAGTAGRPVLGVLKKSGLTDVLLTVARWYGGVKLGTGGLVRAYTESAQLALAEADVAELIPRTNFRLTLTYEHYESVRRRLAEFGVEISAEDFGAAVTLTGTVPAAAFDLFNAAVGDLTCGAAQLQSAPPDSIDKQPCFRRN